jgi:transposase
MRRAISAEKKEEVLAYVDKYNSKNGRGGKTAASKKFKVSQGSIMNWMRQKKKPSSKVTAGKKDTMKKEIPDSISAIIQELNSFSKVLNRLTKRLNEIA